MKILSVTENIKDPRNLDIKYEDKDGNIIPYQLEFDARGPFANAIRSKISGVKPISAEAAKAEMNNRQQDIINSQNAARKRKDKKINDLSAELAKAIVSGKEKDIQSALAKTLSSL